MMTMPTSSKSTLLIVDDVPANLRVLVSYLKNFNFKVRVAQDGVDALEQVRIAAPDLILLDIMMPRLNGLEVCRRLKADPKTKEIPVIFMSALDDTFDKIMGFEAGSVDYITKPFQHEEVLARINTHLTIRNLQEEVKQQNELLEQRVQERTKELEETRLQIIRSLGKAAEYRDNETGMHVVRISKYVGILADALQVDSEQRELMVNAAPMHDVGKIGIPDHILLKRGRLSPDEWDIMRTHTIIGEKILSGNDSELLKAASLLARTHHERWDGSGYPDGLKEEKIPLISRIVSICDVFDALLSRRPYKEPWTPQATIEYIKEESGKHFDPLIVKAFEEKLPELLAIHEQYCD
jgi:putative two-component system response regulator